MYQRSQIQTHRCQTHHRTNLICRMIAVPKEQTGNIITFSQFEEGVLSSETRYNAESGDESDDD